MTFIAAAIAIDRPDAVSPALHRAAEARRRGASLVEWRIDGLAEQPGAAAAAARLVADSPMPCIVTCRPAWEGGDYGGDERARCELLAGLLAGSHPPRYLDIELAAYRRDPELRAMIDEALGETSLILSSHDFEGRPPDLLQRVEAAASFPRCGVIKVAWTARSLRDNLEAFELLAQRPKPMIALCMGPFGLPSRVLAGRFGALLTFASDDDAGTAPGQPTVDDLVSRYRFEQIGPDTRVYGIVGWPVAHSRSPELHNGAFAEVDHDGVYLPLPVAPGYEPLKATLGAFMDAGIGFAGASVTLPHKVDLLRFVRESGGDVDELCDRAGAANTLIVANDNTVSCENSDLGGLITVLAAHGIEVRDAAVAVLGAGGMARAAAAALAWLGADVTVFNRTPERATALAESTEGVVAGDAQRLRDGGFTVIVNCTSVGMEGGPAPDDNALNLLAGAPVGLDPSVTVIETVYTPRITPLVAHAVSARATVITGDALFREQAALQFEAWTGKTASVFAG